MATFVIAVKVTKDENNLPIDPNKQQFTFMSRYDSFIMDPKLALEFKSVKAALSWWNSYKKSEKYPERITEVAECVDLTTLSVRQRKTSYKLTESLTI